MNSLQREISEGQRLFEQLIVSFGMRQQPRFTQDVPVRSQVWVEYVNSPEQVVSLILSPNERVPTRSTVDEIRARLDAYNEVRTENGLAKFTPDSIQLMSLASSIHIRVDFDAILKLLVPMTQWWVGFSGESSARVELDEIVRSTAHDLDLSALVTAFYESRNKSYWRFFAIAGLIHCAGNLKRDKTIASGDKNLDLLVTRWRYIRRFSFYLIELGDNPDERNIQNDPAKMRLFSKSFFFPTIKFLYTFLDETRKIDQIMNDKRDRDQAKSIKNLRDPRRFIGESKSDASEKSDRPEEARLGGIWAINFDRSVETSTSRSARTIKADAAARVFDTEAHQIVWAIIDSGIDATHMAFSNRGRSGESKPTRLAADSRVKATYDFNRLQSLFTGAYEELLPPKMLPSISEGFEWTKRTSKNRKNKDILAYLYTRHNARRHAMVSTRDLQGAIKASGFVEEVRDYIENLRSTVINGRLIDWPLIEPIISIGHDEESYEVPGSPHGTHVAGILIGDVKRHELEESPDNEICGICPKMQVYDLRVTDARGGGKEFITLAAIQFVAYLNRNRDLIQVHGVNISLSLKHEVANYACGQTPICIECERLIGDGVVVVAAAGNKGYQKVTSEAGPLDTYNAISITDPGNADGVITVGATHRDSPHSYGVSYFSSRGPTGDGREKPDLVAPGEKIFSAVLGNRADRMDGTSMAAPHVSGAAAMLMARHSELIGNPARIKEILCRTATDLNRRREFQGAGLVDVLRALQSV